MRIYGDTRSIAYPLVPRALQDAPREPGVRDANSTDDASSHGKAPMAAYVSSHARVERFPGVTPQAQRAITAYNQQNQFSQRSQYSELLGVDVYA